MIVEIITPEKEFFKGEAISVKVPGSMGEFEILENHAPIISTLQEGEIRIIKSNNSVEKFHINGGVIEMQKNKVIVLAD